MGRAPRTICLISACFSSAPRVVSAEVSTNLFSTVRSSSGLNTFVTSVSSDAVSAKLVAAALISPGSD